MQAIEANTSCYVPEAQRARRQAMDHWRARAAVLPPHDPLEPFHSAWVKEMDKELELFDRADAQFREPLEVLAVVRNGAEVTGVVADD